MKNINILTLALCLFAFSGFAQKSAAYYNTQAPVVKEAGSISFKITLDHIGDDGEKDAFAQKFRNSEGVLSVSASKAGSGEAVYTINVAEKGFFRAVEMMLTSASIEQVVVDGNAVPVKGYAEWARAEYQKSQSAQRK